MGIKNLWSLNIDECLVADKLKANLKGWEIFFPLNSQLKDIDLYAVNLRKQKTISIQVKGSRTYEASISQERHFGDGGGAWFRLKKSSVMKPTNKLDYYIFVLHNFVDTSTRKKLNIDYLIVPEKELRIICKKKKVRRGGVYHFFIWIDSKSKRSFEFNNKGFNIIPLSKYLNNWKIIK
ncbi:hypothetical protein ACFL0L_00685 [Patescibacteria group bacterium]